MRCRRCEGRQSCQRIKVQLLVESRIFIAPQVVQAPAILLLRLTVPTVDKDRPNGGWCRAAVCIQVTRKRPLTCRRDDTET